MTVGATTSSDARASYSNYGRCLDLFAPGSSIVSAWPTSASATASLSGTSMAAPHVAGAAVDLTLTVDGHPVWMGSDLDATPEQSDGACYTDVAGLDPEVANRRDLLALALGGAGLVNYPTEWWHWSHGDRYWAVVTGASHAVYGPVARVPGIPVPA